MLSDFLKSLDKEQKPNLPVHISSLVFAHNYLHHNVTGYQPYELIFGHKAPTVCDTCLRLAKYNDLYLQSNCAGVNNQHELIISVNW